MPWSPDELKRKFLETLDNCDGLSIKQTASKLGISPATASKWAHILEAERKVKLVRFGDMKIVRRVR